MEQTAAAPSQHSHYKLSHHQELLTKYTRHLQPTASIRALSTPHKPHQYSYQHQQVSTPEKNNHHLLFVLVCRPYG